jgi:hypothetical protein
MNLELIQNETLKKKKIEFQNFEKVHETSIEDELFPNVADIYYNQTEGLKFAICMNNFQKKLFNESEMIQLDIKHESKLGPAYHIWNFTTYSMEFDRCIVLCRIRTNQITEHAYSQMLEHLNKHINDPFIFWMKTLKCINVDFSIGQLNAIQNFYKEFKNGVEYFKKIIKVYIYLKLL